MTGSPAPGMIAQAQRCEQVDVVRAAFAAAGRPESADASDGPAGCARCGLAVHTSVPVTATVSRTFTGFDGWVEPRGARLCVACGWMYRLPSLRSSMHLVTQHPDLEILSPEQLGEILTRAVPTHWAVVVPLRPGRKHVLPHAQWGRVAVDDVALRWGEHETVALAAMRRLRASGFRVRALLKPYPDATDLQGVSRSEWAAVIEDWWRLTEWRRAPLWWAVGVRATTPAAVGGGQR